jgi:putative transposase
MPDHLHIVVEGQSEDSDCKAFIKSAKQYSGYYYSQEHRRRLWDRYGHERIIRDDQELAMTVRYIVANPVRAGLVNHPSGYFWVRTGTRWPNCFSGVSTLKLFCEN